MRDFKNYHIWQQGFELGLKIYEATSRFPSEEKYGLAAHMRKTAISITSNIAEGASRRSQRDFLRFLEISRGSLFELESQILIAEPVTKTNLAEVLALTRNTQRSLHRLVTKIEQDQRLA